MMVSAPVSPRLMTVEELVRAGVDPRAHLPQLDARTLQAYLHTGRSSSQLQDAPDWLARFDAAFASAGRMRTTGTDVPRDAALAAAFAPLVAPASQDVSDRLAASPLRVDASAVRRDVERAMYAKLFAMSSRALVVELAAAQSTGLLQGDTAEDRFDFFCACLKEPSFGRAVLSQYPVLARQATLAVHVWRDALLEFADRIANDAQEIAQRVFGASFPGQLSRLRLSAGDSHRGGRSVIVAEFDGGARRIVYKPRSLRVDRCFADLVAWLAERGLSPAPRLPSFVEKPGYGWVEYVAAEACRSAGEVTEFYRRQGVNVALLYFLNGTDLHSENIIAAGADPVLIDLEALFHPTVAAPRGGKAHDATQRQIDVSALATGILPVRAPRATPESEWLDMSGMSGADAREIPFELPVWVDAETDNMRMRLERTALEPDDNLPVFDGERIGPRDHVDAIVEGFTHTYETICANRAGLLAAGGPVANFADAEVRVIVRNTARYEQIMYDSMDPRFLRDVRDREQCFDTLWSEAETRPVLARLHRAERHDLWNGDIPVFSATPSSTTLHTSTGETITGAIEESAIEAVMRRIAAAGARDLDQQRFFIEVALADAQSVLARRALSTGHRHVGDAGQISNPRLLASAIGEHLIETAVHAAGGANWIVLEETDGGHASIGAAAYDLYSGLPGIALFLARLADATGEQKFRLVGDEAVAALTDLLASDEKRHLGCFTGLSGVAYALSSHRHWHDGPAMRSVLARLDRTGLFDEVEDLDVISGLAGATLALLAAWRHTGIEVLRERAFEAGRALFRRAQPCLTPPGTDAPGFGFGHGPIGAAVALARFGIEASRPDASRLALSISEAEIARFHAALRTTERTGEPVATSWCNGASGLLLGVMETNAASPGVFSRAALEPLIDFVITQHEEPSDCLCHGSLGTLSILTRAAARGLLANERVTALERTTLARLDVSGIASGTVGGLHSPGLMDGLSGIGLALLQSSGRPGMTDLLCID